MVGAVSALAGGAPGTDTIEGLAARRLVDEEATHSVVSDAILSTLENAQEDDVIVITFAGHGSRRQILPIVDGRAATRDRQRLLDAAPPPP